MAKNTETPTVDEEEVNLENLEELDNAEDEEYEVDDVDTDTEVDDAEDETEDESSDTDGEEETEEDDGIEEVPFLGKQRKLEKEEKKVVYQKGLNYDHLKEKSDKAEQELAELKLKLASQEITDEKTRLAAEFKKDGYYTDAEIAEKIEKSASFKKAQQLLDDAKSEAQKGLILNKRKAEKDALRNKPYFNDLETELDKMLSQPNNEKVPADVAYKFLVGEMLLNGGIDKVLKKTKQSAIADYQDKAKRGKRISSDGQRRETTSVDNILSDKGKAMAAAFGIDPKEVAKYKAKHLKRKG